MDRLQAGNALSQNRAPLRVHLTELYQPPGQSDMLVIQVAEVVRPRLGSPGEPAYGCGAPTTEAKALWRQIGLLGAEARTLGPVIMKSCPSKLEIDPSSKVWVRALVSGLDTIVLFCVNDDYSSDENGTTVYPVDNAEVNVKVPTWLEPKEVFEVNYRGVQDIGSKDSAGWLNVRLGKVEVSRLLVITSDPGLRERLKTRYRESFQNNVQSLLADSP